jgi:hypothetical protein
MLLGGGLRDLDFFPGSKGPGRKKTKAVTTNPRALAREVRRTVLSWAKTSSSRFSSSSSSQGANQTNKPRQVARTSVPKNKIPVIQVRPRRCHMMFLTPGAFTYLHAATGKGWRYFTTKSPRSQRKKEKKSKEGPFSLSPSFFFGVHRTLVV